MGFGKFLCSLASFIQIRAFTFLTSSPWRSKPMDAPWETPDPFTSVQQLQGLVGHGFNVGHDSTGDLQALIQSALGGIRKEVDTHMDFLETEHDTKLIIYTKERW